MTLTVLVAAMVASSPAVAVSVPPETATLAVLATFEVEIAASVSVTPAAAGAAASTVVTFDVAVKLRLPAAVRLPLSTCDVRAGGGRDDAGLHQPVEQAGGLAVRRRSWTGRPG